MIEVVAKLGRGPVFLAGELLECVITFTNPLSAASTSASRYGGTGPCSTHTPTKAAPKGGRQGVPRQGCGAAVPAQPPVTSPPKVLPNGASCHLHFGAETEVIILVFCPRGRDWKKSMQVEALGEVLLSAPQVAAELLAENEAKLAIRAGYLVTPE